ncbi:hypothetical protein B296_00036855, partial [Ensete ventricosum]
PSNWRKKRIHFHDFMLNVHSRLQVRVVAAEISDESILLCLDEFMAENDYYFIGKKYSGLLREKFHQLIGAEKPGPQVVEVVMGRKIVTVMDAQKIYPRSSSRSWRTDDIDLCVDNELGFTKDRTISRLAEMNSKEYLEQHEANVKDKTPQK